VRLWDRMKELPILLLQHKHITLFHTEEELSYTYSRMSRCTLKTEFVRPSKSETFSN